jgi:predicted RNA-binding protein with PIN domain
MAEVLIVDGHSAIFALAGLRERHGVSGVRARAELVGWLQAYSDVSPWHVVVVFDGRQAQRGRAGGAGEEIMVIYSKGIETADSVIERMVARQAGKGDRIRVASNDRMVLDTCDAFGAEGMSIRSLAEEVGRVVEAARRQWRPDS